MEKIGVEISNDGKLDKDLRKKLEKTGQIKKSQCSHPVDKVYNKDGVKFCYTCNKYLEINK